MTSRERLLLAIDRKAPDRLPAQVHSWMPYYLNTYLGGVDQYQAYERFGLDWVIYTGPRLSYSQKALTDWQVERKDLGQDESGNNCWMQIITTPEGTLTSRGAYDAFTHWDTEVFGKSKREVELFLRYFPEPESIDFAPVVEARDKTGDNGIVRGGIYAYGQAGPWQSFCCLVGTERAIYYAVDEPDWVHHVLQSLVNKQLPSIEMMRGIPFDLVETGGGAGSNTVISPALHKEFCTRYDRQLHDALHAVGLKVVYHLCGGVMQMLENVVDNGADGLETMTPVAMGGDCDLAEAYRGVGDKLFLVGGFDQSTGFESGTPEKARQLVLACHAACPNGGYICSPSDHFFKGDPENVQAFADAAKECRY